MGFKNILLLDSSCSCCSFFICQLTDQLAGWGLKGVCRYQLIYWIKNKKNNVLHVEKESRLCFIVCHETINLANDKKRNKINCSCRRQGHKPIQSLPARSWHIPFHSSIFQAFNLSWGAARKQRAQKQCDTFMFTPVLNSWKRLPVIFLPVSVSSPLRRIRTKQIYCRPLYY